MSKKLIINADDYGRSTEVNDAIENLVDLGELTDVSVLANGWSYEGAASFLKDHRHCSVGIHLNVIEGVALSPSDNVKVLMGVHGQFVNLRQIFLRWIASPLAVARAVETEWRAQIELLLRDGLEITHADSHQHIHAFPPFWRIASKLCAEYGIPALRFPRERNKVAGRRIEAAALALAATVSRMLPNGNPIITSDHFIGFKRTGIYDESKMADDLSHLKDGVTELIVHPSLYDGVPYLDMNGESDFKAIQSAEVRQQIKEQKIERVTWRDIVTA